MPTRVPMGGVITTNSSVTAGTTVGTAATSGDVVSRFIIFRTGH